MFDAIMYKKLVFRDRLCCGKQPRVIHGIVSYRPRRAVTRTNINVIDFGDQNSEVSDL